MSQSLLLHVNDLLKKHVHLVEEKMSKTGNALINSKLSNIMLNKI